MDNNMNPFNGGNGNGSGNGSQGPNGSGGSEQNNPRRTSLILLAIAAIVTLISMSLFMRMINNATNQEITYGKFQELVEGGKAAEVTWDYDLSQTAADKPEDTVFCDAGGNLLYR